MENKKQNSTGKTVAIIILVGLLVCSLGYIAYDKFLYNATEEETNKEETSNKKENLDVNSRLVHGLYRKVSTGETSKDNSSCTFNYMYENKEMLEEYEIKSAENIIYKKSASMEDDEIRQFLLKKGYKTENINKAFDN